MTTLDQLPIGAAGRVTRVGGAAHIRRRLLELGLVEHTRVTALGTSPGGGIRAYLIRGAVIALRDGDAAGVAVEEVEEI
ncbi:MAG: ferrous iron transport protein A [Oscillospiraceae bacterium]|nr:ferrous iron transport protein A [Oscillospiraceae bacterium]